MPIDLFHPLTPADKQHRIFENLLQDGMARNVMSFVNGPTASGSLRVRPRLK